jgi:hypothetical protein
MTYEKYYGFLVLGEYNTTLGIWTVLGRYDVRNMKIEKLVYSFSNSIIKLDISNYNVQERIDVINEMFNKV